MLFTLPSASNETLSRGRVFGACRSNLCNNSMAADETEGLDNHR